MSAAAAMIAAIEHDFKRYIVICEYLQIDPTVVYDIQDITSRTDKLLQSVEKTEDKAYKRLTKDLEWFARNYSKLIGRSYGFLKRSKKLIEKGYLQVLPETVNAELTFKSLTQNNYDFYAQKQRKIGWIALGITLGVLLVGGIILAIILL